MPEPVSAHSLALQQRREGHAADADRQVLEKGQPRGPQVAPDADLGVPPGLRPDVHFAAQVRRGVRRLDEQLVVPSAARVQDLVGRVTRQRAGAEIAEVAGVVVAPARKFRRSVGDQRSHLGANEMLHGG